MPANVETMAYHKAEVPWHGLGNPVGDRTGVDEMLTAAKLDWEVALASVQFRHLDAAGKRRQATDEKHNVLYRADTLDVLDVVGPRYVPFQNREVLEFFREYVEAGDMRLETAGSLNGGQHIWALAKMDEAFEVLVPDDRVEGYVLLMNPHLYGKSAVVKFTGVRVVCYNTLTAALGDGRGSLKLWHTREFNDDLREEAKRRLGIAREQLEAYRRDAELLATLDLTDEQAVRVAASVMGGDPTDPDYDEQPRATRRVLDLYAGAGKGSQLVSAKGTAWGLFNAVTQYVDHEYGWSPNNRLTYAWLGSGETRKRKTLTALLELVA